MKVNEITIKLFDIDNENCGFRFTTDPPLTEEEEFEIQPCMLLLNKIFDILHEDVNETAPTTCFH